MSTALESVIPTIQQNDFLTLITAVGYDYVLTLPKEIEYIWRKPWTRVSTLFVVVRYIGLCGFVLPTLSEIMYIASLWMFIPFLGAADFVMILRAWAIYDRSKLIFAILLMLLSLELISTAIGTVVVTRAMSRNAIVIVTVEQLPNFSFCSVQPTQTVWEIVSTTFQMANATALCILVIVQYGRQSFHMYKVTKSGKLSQYMTLMVKEGILYFIVFFMVMLTNLLSSTGLTNALTAELHFMLLTILEFVPVYTLIPRFIISIRELYAHDLQGGPSENGIDTGFGMAGRGGADSEMMFVNVGQNDEVSEDTEESLVEIDPMQLVEMDTSRKFTA